MYAVDLPVPDIPVIRSEVIPSKLSRPPHTELMRPWVTVQRGKQASTLPGSPLRVLHRPGGHWTLVALGCELQRVRHWADSCGDVDLGL
jgi:hypothetical protein